MHSLKEDYPLLLNNIAQILSSDPMLGAALLVGQNVDLEVFVYYLLDAYPRFNCKDKFSYRYKSNYYSIVENIDGHYHHFPNTIDDMSDWLLHQLNNLINEYKQNI